MPTLRSLTSPERLDRVGIAASTLCAIHCMVMPLLILLMPLTAIRPIAGSGAEWTFFGISAVIAASSLLPSYFSRHRRSTPLKMFGTGLVLIGIARLAFENYVVGETILVVAGALFITASHVANRRFCKACSLCRLNASTDDRPARGR